MPLGAARISFLAKTQVTAVAEVIRKKQSIRAINDAQVDTADYKFSGASLSVTGTDDALETTFVKTFDASGDFTIEMWAKGRGFSTRGKMFATYPHHGALANSIFIDINSSTSIRCYIDGANRVTTSTWDWEVWNHVALQRTGTAFEMFVNGTRVLNYTQSTPKDYSMDDSAGFHLGGTYSSAGVYTDEFNGWFDEVRCSEIARYTSGASITVPTAPFVNDNYTALLIHCDGTDASTYFEDDNGKAGTYSTGRSITVSAVNDAQVDTAQSQFGNSSAYFDGTGDYLIISGNDNNIDFSGDFTIECWFRSGDTSLNAKIFDGRGIDASEVGGGDGLVDIANTILLDHNGNAVRVYLDGGDRASGSSITSNTWYHLAISRTSGTVNAWLNGTRIVNYSCSDDFTNVFNKNQPIGMGASVGLNQPWLGHIDEFRISTVARYTNGASITVPTAPFVNDSDTYLLLHMDGDDGSTLFQDDDGSLNTRSAVSVSAEGLAQLDTAEYQFGVASAEFGGAGNDYLLVPSKQGLVLNSDFTIEMWINAGTRANTGTATRLARFDADGSATATGLEFIFYDGSAYTDNLCVSFGSPRTYIVGTIDAVTSSWVHVALSRSGTDMKLFINGTQSGSTATTSASFNSNDTYAFNLGRHNTLGGFFNGHVDEFRISNTARYTANFTPSTTPFVNDDNTLLLLHMDGTDQDTDFQDDNGKGRSRLGIVAEDAAQVDTSESKFGGASYLGDRAAPGHLTTRLRLIPATDPFTIECWVNLDVVDNNTWIVSQYLSSEAGRMTIYTGGAGGELRLFAGSVILEGTTGLSTNTWYHIAVCRDSSNEFRLYVNGSLEDTATSTVSISQSSPTLIGRGLGTSSRYVDGHIDELRISSIARYTTSFTAPTAPFQNDADTILLLHMDGSNGSTVFVDDNGTY